jgi:zinc transporter 1/2/3
MELSSTLSLLEAQTAAEEAEAKTVKIIKIVFIFAIFIIAFVSGILPAKIKGCGTNKTFMGLANSFSGGLFLAIALVHVLPEVTDEYNEIMEKR